MGGVFERPAFWLLLVLVLLVAVIALVVTLAVKAGGKRAAPVAQPAGLPGWYPQPDGSQRYWDGRTWTEGPAPAP